MKKGVNEAVGNSPTFFSSPTPPNPNPRPKQPRAQPKRSTPEKGLLFFFYLSFFFIFHGCGPGLEP